MKEKEEGSSGERAGGYGRAGYVGKTGKGEGGFME